MTTIKMATYHTPVPSEEDLIRLADDVYHLKHPYAYLADVDPSEPQDWITKDLNSIESYYLKTSDMFVVDVPHCQRRIRGLLTIGEEVEESSGDYFPRHLYKNGDYFPRHLYKFMEEQKVRSTQFLTAAEVDELVGNADEPAIYPSINMNNSASFIEEASSRSFTEECDGDVATRRAGFLTEKDRIAIMIDDLATIASSEETTMEVPVAANKHNRDKNRRAEYVLLQ